MYFSFSVIFSFLAIFQVLQWAFLIFHVFQWFCNFSGRKWMFLIFHDFQFSCYIPHPTVDISKLSNFFSFPHHISRPKVCITHILWYSGFSPYSRSYNVHFSFFPSFSDFVIFQVLKCVFLIFHDFQFSCHIPCPPVDISHFSAFSVFPAIFHVLNCVFLMIHIFSYLAFLRSYSVHSSFFMFFKISRHISLPK